MLLVVAIDLTNYVESMVLLICVVPYFVNVSGMLLSLVSVFRLLYIFPFISSLSTTLYCVN